MSADPNAIFTYGMRKPPRFWSLEPDGFIKMEGLTKGVGSVIPPVPTPQLCCWIYACDGLVQ